ncbi:lymphocyte antigen 75 [Astyanax mexicanus]|uniref:lymphocyte antigen 75 n=1 Tax=Astyanax mexicanus TaxID=7994 RepID=UPI0020CB1270|nr:lymphocyte antigen 75 [Astyanax mexicanus]
MDRAGRAVLGWLLCVVLGQSAVRCGGSGDGTFTIQHEGSRKCLQVQHGALVLGNCSAEPSCLWKWGSARRLFHTGSSACLGMYVPNKTLSLTSCLAEPQLQWYCNEGSLFTIYQMKLSATANGTVVAKREAPDSWIRGGTSENICQQMYQMMHTSGGNSLGAPCKFPFLYNGTWHHRCLPADDVHPPDWCSTKDSYDQDQQWGTCLKYEEGCGALWNISRNGRCYQVISTALVTWHEARDSCRTQGGDLLSVSSSEDLQIFNAGSELPEKLWIGLNRLDWLQGWQWSDGSPLAYIPWNAESLSESLLLASDCGVLRPNRKFDRETCESRLPYICEKMENSTQTAEAADKMMYKSTVCDDGWTPQGGFCYKLYGNESSMYKTYADAQKVCLENGAQLASIHSLGDVELLNTDFSAVSNVWIGLKAVKNTDLFKWEDGTNVSFTYWGRTQPPLLSSTTDSCVKTDHVWFVSPCTSASPFVCKKNGTVNESAADEGCPQDGDWRRHGNACYKIDTREVSYKNSCKLIINNRFEQAFINSLLKEHIGSESLFFWTGLQDSKGTGEYQWFSPSEQKDRVTYTNWRWPEPANTGGCAVMSTASPLGQWFVKNCTVFKAGSICKRLVSPAPPVPAPEEPNINATCPQGWVSRDGMKYCYKVFHEERLSRKRSWEEAELFCEALGAHLPSFTELNEMTGLHNILRDSISDDRFFWVGFNRRNPNNDNSWEWSDGRPVSMTMFPQEFHEDDDYNRDCTAFKSLKVNFKLLFFFLLHDVPVRPFYPSAFHCDAKLEWVCQIPRGITPKNPEWYNPDGHHNTSVFIDGQEFWFVNQPQLSFEEAIMYCSSNSSRLATPNTINAARLLQEHLYKNSGPQLENWWVDLRQPGSLLPMRYSHRHYYNSAFLGRCTSISQNSIMPEYRKGCEVKQPFVCETLNVTSAETGTQDPEAPAKPCEEGTLAFRDKCFTVTKPGYMSFKQANERCHTLRGTLLSVRDQAEQDFITTLLPGLPRKLWIGLKLRQHDTQWVDKSDVKYLNFNPLLHGQLRPIYIYTFEQDGLELCAYMFNNAHSDMLGTWDYTSCSHEQSVAICQHYADKPEAPVVSQDEFTVNNHTFKLVLRENLNWIDAWDLCKSNNMDLASVSDAYLQAVLTVNVSKVGHPLWIGLFSEDEHYRWTDHSHTVFSRWSDEVTAGRCVYLDTDGFWKATECGRQLGGAICHVPHETVQPSHDKGPCPHKGNGANWIPFKNNCYTFLLASVRWQEHDKNNDRNTCQAIAGMGDILTIRSEEENEFIRTQLQPYADLASFVWLGIYKANGSQLKWYDDTNVQYSNWKNGRPDVPPLFMAGLNMNGEWDLIDSYFSSFKQNAIVVCKIERDSKTEFQLSQSDVKAPPGYTFRLIPKKLNWYQALEECSSDGGHLVSIHSEEANKDMALITKRDGFPHWIGLSRQDFSGWPFEWSDGTSLQFQPQGFEVLGVGSEEQCVYVDPEGRWSAVNCHAKLEGAICYKTVNKSQMSAHSSDNCPKSDGKASWIQFEDHCYAIDMTLYNYSVYSMVDAQRICETLDPTSQLLTIKSEEENDFVSRHVAENPLITSRVWLALKSAVGESWMDGSALGFSNWGHTQPQSGCAVLVAVNGSWNNASCMNSRSRVVCKAPAKSSAGTPVALAFFIIVLFCLVAVVIFVVYKRTRHRFFSTVRYQRNFDEADSTSMISETE